MIADAMKMLMLARHGGWVFDADDEFLQAFVNEKIDDFIVRHLVIDCVA